MRNWRIGLAQINCTVGDLEGNTDKMLICMDQARRLNVDLLCFPELAITGYPPEDLLLKPEFITDNLEKLDILIRNSEDITAVVGFVDPQDDLYNAAAVFSNGKLKGIYHKRYLPNYSVFDEHRYFQSGTEVPIFVIGGTTVGISICEDIWYSGGPATLQAQAGAEIIVNINCSPYYSGKRDSRERMLATRACDDSVILAYVNMVGGQDELVFDGGSLILDARGEVIARGKQFEEDFIVVDLDLDDTFRSRLHDPRRRKFKKPIMHHVPDITKIEVSPASSAKERPAITPNSYEVYEPTAEVYQALVLGTHDYIRKNGFSRVLIGLSGGIDSSLVAVIAVDAIGAENIVGVSMPSQYSSDGSRTDAQLLAENLGIEIKTIPIDTAFQGCLNVLAPSFEGTQPGLAEENLQARVRGNILMALSNKFGWLVLTTGNKSEVACGYCTLYGDMAGGFAVIKDVPKMLVYELSRYRNTMAERDIIPQSVIEKEPSAELRPDQKDTDSLPPYDELDPIIEAYVEKDKSISKIVAMGYDLKTVQRVALLIDSSEYKRRQSPPGVKITPRAFGRDRRLPITNRYKSS